MSEKFRKLERWPLVSGLARIPPGMQSSPPSASSPPHTPTAEPPDDVERNNPSGGLEDSQLLSTSNQMRAKLRNRSSGGVQKRLAHTQASANAIRRPRQQATQDPDPTPHLTFALPSTPKPVKTLPSSSSSRLMQMPGDGSNAVGAPLDLNSLVAAVTNGNAVNVNTHHTFNFYL
ncbi:hypothetical protein V5O48_005732 [Marasmius crinis-equi]|uniref:Uncharacterized protein n=1 Tax=Marasmius crinis-equi TaxID=585013 RepID=A0ABR3FLN6_9AGAR